MSDAVDLPGSPLTITAIVCARDAERYLGETLDSIRAQDRRADQVVVVDDGSDDSTGRIASTHPVGATVLRTSGVGLSAARNLAIASTESDAVSFLDADDIWLPNCLVVLETALTQSGAMLAFGHVEQFASPDLTADERARIMVPEGVEPGYNASSLLAKRDCFSIAGSFDESLRAGDFVAWLIECRHHHLTEVLAPDLVLRRRHHSANMGRNHDIRPDYVRLLRASIQRSRERSPDGPPTTPV